MKREVIERWVVRLKTLTSELALPTKPSEQFIAGFADGMGDRRAIDAPILARLLNCSPDQKRFTEHAGDDAAVAIMKAAGRDDIAAALRSVKNSLDGTPWPLAADPRIAALEGQTELELAAVHGFAVLALRHGSRHPELTERLLGAVRWLMREIQPDNATHRPWSVHAFVWSAAILDGNEGSEAELYADTLVHNALVAGSHGAGRMDVFSAILLRDSAEVLFSMLAGAGDTPALGQDLVG